MYFEFVPISPSTIRGLNEDGLAVRGGHPQLVQLFDGGRNHTGDDARRRVVLLDLVFTNVQPALDVAAGLGGRPMAAVFAKACSTSASETSMTSTMRFLITDMRSPARTVTVESTRFMGSSRTASASAALICSLNGTYPG